MTTMTDDDLKEAVAKKLGWKIGQRALTMTWWIRPSDNHWCEELPDFPTRLDACEPVKKWLREHGYAIHTTNYITGKTSVTLSKTVFEDASSCEDSESRALCLAFLEVEE